MQSQSNSLFLYLVRHGESHSNSQSRIQGHSDSGLNDRGLRQAGKVARRLAGHQFDRVYSSDLGRAITTCRAITSLTGHKPVIDKRLREICLGEWEGLTTDEVNARYRRGYDRWLKSPTRMKIPGAETVGEFHARVRQRTEAIMKSHASGRVLIVTHGGVIASLVSDWLRSNFDHTLLNLRIDNTSITVVEKNSQRVKIHLLNDIGHLGKRDLNQHNIFTRR
ncbi:MAG: histidine phosphatase family protein [Candidatus Omnitrophica bacterium]|nr:histidine phosphatase family protein [Candidatus Omnitrophota bacterium]